MALRFRRRQDGPRRYYRGAWSDANADNQADTSRHDALHDLPLVLRELEQEAAAPGVRVVELQPIVQLSTARHYGRWSRGVQASWKRAGYVADEAEIQWPSSIPPGHLAGLLVVVPAGRVGIALGRHPVPEFAPRLAFAQLPESVSGADFALHLLLMWLSERGVEQTARLAPPVVERIDQGRVAHREVQTYGTAWPLPPADGV